MSSRRKRGVSPTSQSQRNNEKDGNILEYNRSNGRTDKMKRLCQLEQLQSCDTKITCCDFGVDRETLFPQIFFCSRCKDWENRAKENKRLHRGMKKFTCTADHKSYITPSKIDTIWCLSKSRNDITIINKKGKVSEKSLKMQISAHGMKKRLKMGVQSAIVKGSTYFKWYLVLRPL